MRQRLLIASSRFPYPTLGGDKVFIANVAKALEGRYRLTLLCMCETREELTREVPDSPYESIHRIYLPKWRSVVRAAAAMPTNTPMQLEYYRSPEFQAKLSELAPQHDAILAHLIRTGHHLRGIESIPKILLMADAISLNYRRIQSLPESYCWKTHVYAIEQHRLWEYERGVFDRFSQVWLHSDPDREFLGVKPSENIRILPMGIDLNEFHFGPRAGNFVIFIGNMSSVQNQDACFYFIEQILPHLRKEADIRFRIVGNAPDKIRKRLSCYQHVETTGRVDRIEDHVEGGFCGICPIRAGAGVQNKILNYFALGLPCVTSQVGFEGLTAMAGRDLLVYDQPAQAARQILALFKDETLRSGIAQRARCLVERHYSWTSLHAQIREDVASVLEQNAALPVAV